MFNRLIYRPEAASDAMGRTLLPSALVLLLLSGGCFATNRDVDVWVENDTDRSVRLTLHAWFSLPNATIEYGNGSHEVGPHARTQLLAFPRPCERRLTGDLVLDADLDNGTRVLYRKPWLADGCGPQHCALRLTPSSAAFECRYGE